MTIFESACIHQYIDRTTGEVVTERLVGDKSIAFLYHRVRENAPALFRIMTSARLSSLLARCRYDLQALKPADRIKVFSRLGIDPSECVEPLGHFTGMRRIFERQIRYWESRPMDDDQGLVVSPADARLLIGSLTETSALFIKEKFFDLEELLGRWSRWQPRFIGGDFAVFRLTPDKYHYNHLPVAGKILDIYEVDGCYHSCNPLAQVAVASIHSKNRRVVTIIDTDVDGGTHVGLVAMIEVVAMMIGDVKQAYSTTRYEDPQDIRAGLFVQKGAAKSLYRPGSSTDVLLFEAGRIRFCTDLIQNSRRSGIKSRFVHGFKRPLVETDVRVRSPLARRDEWFTQPRSNR